MSSTSQQTFNMSLTTLQNPTVIPQDEFVPQHVKFNLKIISDTTVNTENTVTTISIVSTETNDFPLSIQVIPQDPENLIFDTQEYFGESEDNYSQENLTKQNDNQTSMHEYFGESDCQSEQDANLISPDPDIYFSENSKEFSQSDDYFSESEKSSEFISQKIQLEDLPETPMPITDWGICISCEQKECCICFETKQVFTPSCCGEKQDICLDCIWNVIKQKVPKRQQLDKKIIEKYLLSDFSCCFCREKTKINIHIPSMFPNLFLVFCKSILNTQKPKKKRGRPPIKKKSKRGRPRKL